MKIKKITAVLLAASLITTTALASVLGTETYSSVEVDVAQGTTYINNVFISDQSGVGKQTENYYEYKPNDGIKPVIVNDTYIYGKSTVSNMLGKIRSQGLYPIMMMNSDFFSFKTGVPMGHQIVDGVIATKDSSGEDALGINPDGSGFVSWLTISTTVKVGENIINVENINKYPQPYAIYMLTDKFSDTTRAEKPSYNVIIGSASGEMKLDSEVTGVVEEVMESDGAIPIPRGKIVLVVDKEIAAERMEQMKLFNVGDSVTITNSAAGDSRWAQCTYIQGSVGGRLIKDGQVQNVDEAAAPRSAVGIKSDGSIIFYTIDGRQTGYSYGVRLKTLSNRLLELGCVDAINFDGGGSTCIAGIYPGESDAQILNKPSEGKERSVATFFALMNTRAASGVPGKLHLKPYGGNYLSGATQQFSVSATDTNDYPVAFSGEVTYSSDGSSYTSTTGYAKLVGNGKVTVRAVSGDISGSSTVTVFTNPDTISIHDVKTGNAINSLAVNGGDSVQVFGAATVGSKRLISDNGCYKWDVTGDIGSINSDGIFTASKISGSGNITATAGNKAVSIPVTVTGDKYASVSGIDFSEDESNVYAKFTGDESLRVEKENISVSVDGKKTDFSYDDSVVTIPAEGGMKKKIMVAATNSAGSRTIKSYTTAGKAYDNQFTDTTTHWGRDVISYMADRKIVNGVRAENGTYRFEPDKNMTRAEFAVMTANYLGINPSDYKVLTVPFADKDSLPSWAAVQIKALYTMGIMNGKTYADGSVRFDSTANVTRAEVVTVLTRVLGESIDTVPLNFSDIADVPSYALGGFTTMYSMGVVSGYDDGSLKPNKNITKAEAVKMIYGIY